MRLWLLDERTVPMSNIYAIKRDGDNWLVTQSDSNKLVARTASISEALQRVNRLKFGDRHNTEKPMQRCRGCGGNVMAEWESGSYCEDCRRDAYLADYEENYCDDED